ncbi:unnamed protein product [Caenorhabditis brenneri]
MGHLALTALLLAITASSVVDAAKCRGRYMEMRGGDGFVTRGGCRGLDSQIQEEYWATVGFDGALRDGRTTDDFLVFPENENNGHTQRNSFVAYWITRSKYGENVHYEAFGHAFIKPDGRVCGWFVGSQKEVVEVCGGFRILSRSRYNPHQPIPFEWVQGPQYRNRDVLGFHHHKIAKYEHNGDEVLFGDADVKSKKFNAVSVSNEERVQLDDPEAFHRKVWLLRKKSLQPPSDNRLPPAVVSETRRREDLDIYQDPHHEERLQNMRLNPYYDQYGRPIGSNRDNLRSNYDSFEKRFPVDGSSSSQNSQNLQKDNNQISHNYQFYDANQQPPRNHPGYQEWLINQYRIRGITPRKYGQDDSFDTASQYGYPPKQTNPNDNDDQSGYNSQSNFDNSEANRNNQVFYEAGQEPNALKSSQTSENGETYYSVNPGAPLDEASAAQRKVTGEFSETNVPGQQEGSSILPVKEQDKQQHVRFIRYHPPTVIRDKKGNIYERRVENGKVYYFDASGNGIRTQIDDSAIDQKIERILEKRRRQEENTMRNLVENADNSEDDGSDPVTAAEVGRQG